MDWADLSSGSWSGGAGVYQALSDPHPHHSPLSAAGEGCRASENLARVTQPARAPAAAHLDKRVIDLHVRLHEAPAAYHNVLRADRQPRTAQQQQRRQQQRRGTPARTHGPASACLPFAARPVPPLTPHAAGSFLLLAGLTSPGPAPAPLRAGAPRPCDTPPRKTAVTQVPPGIAAACASGVLEDPAQPLQGATQAGFTVTTDSFLLIDVVNKSQIFLTYVFHKSDVISKYPLEMYYLVLLPTFPLPLFHQCLIL